MKPVSKRSNNRIDTLLEAAAKLFASKGFKETTMRDIASELDMLPGSIYYHFSSKEELLLEIYEAGVKSFVDGFADAISAHSDPWDRLRAAMAFHVAAITEEDSYTRVVNRVLPEHVKDYHGVIRDMRNQYDRCFRNLIDSLPLAPSVDKTLLRMMILGAGNHVQIWFNADGPQKADDIGEAFANFLTHTIAAAPGKAGEGRGRANAAGKK
ncbi:MAG: TetR/AcrR family transcriptional regulator [Hyphomonas sp.]